LRSRLDAVFQALRQLAGDEGDGSPLVADAPATLSGASRRCAPQAACRIAYLDARKLAKSLKNRVSLLRKGESPAQLSLGEDCVQPSCEQLLVFLFRQWCQPKAARVERRPAADAAKVSSGMQAIHYALSGAGSKRCAWLRTRGVAARGRERAGPAHGRRAASPGERSATVNWSPCARARRRTSCWARCAG